MIISMHRVISLTSDVQTICGDADWLFGSLFEGFVVMDISIGKSVNGVPLVMNLWVLACDVFFFFHMAL